MIDPTQAFLLGVLQGITEYLPVSSSGHLVLAQSFFGLTEPLLFFDVALHVGTLLAVVVYYGKDLGSMTRDTVGGLRDLLAGQPWRQVHAVRPTLDLVFAVVVGTIPTAAVGLAFEDTVERLFASPTTVGVMLWVTAGLLVLTRWATGHGAQARNVRLVDALIIGAAQGMAIAPGLSRSGATICVALFLGVEPRLAARYSFLLSVPAILGALVLKLDSAAGQVGPQPLVAGFLAAAVTGFFCLILMVRLVHRGRLFWFAPYCAVVGLLALWGGR